MKRVLTEKFIYYAYTKIPESKSHFLKTQSAIPENIIIIIFVYP